MFPFLFYCTVGTGTLSFFFTYMILVVNILTSQKQDLTEQKLLWPVNVYSHHPKTILSPFHVIPQITVMLCFQKIIIIIVIGSLTVFIFLILSIGLQQFPVVPLFGDVQIALVSYLKMCPNFEGMREKWTAAADGANDKVVDQYNLLRRMDSIREEHVKFISELARYRNEVSVIA